MNELGQGIRARLLQHLRTHQPADSSERASLKQIIALVARGPRPWSREELSPGHLTASALVVDPGRSAVLLIFHDKLQRWLQPGGHFEASERDPQVAARREVLEETLLRAHPLGADLSLLDVDVHRIPARAQEATHKHFDLRLLLEAEGEPAAGDGVSACRWVKPAEFAALDLDPGLRRALTKVPWGAAALPT